MNISILMKGLEIPSDPPESVYPTYHWASIAKNRVAHAFAPDGKSSVCGRVCRDQAKVVVTNAKQCKNCLNNHVVEVIHHELPDIEKLNYGDSYLVKTTVRANGSRTSVYYTKVTEDDRKETLRQLGMLLFSDEILAELVAARRSENADQTNINET